RARELAVLDDLESRRRTGAEPLGLDRFAAARGHAAVGAVVRAARLGVRVPGRGTRTRRSGGSVRIAARSLRHRVLAGVQGSRRLPHAHALGIKRTRGVLQRRALAAGAATASLAVGRGTGAGCRIGSARLSPAVGLAPGTGLAHSR